MGIFKKSTFLAGAVTAAMLSFSGFANASILFSGTGAGCANATCTTLTGNTNSATALFTISGNMLSILLSNTSADPASGTAKPGDGLTGLSFKIGATLTNPTAVTQAGIFNFAACSTGLCTSALVQNISGEWGLSSAFPSAGRYGISSSGYLPGGSPFGSPDLDSPAGLDGINFSIISPNWSAGEMNAGLGSEPQIIGSALFTFLGVNGTLENSISDVRFWYGTAPDGPGVCGSSQINSCSVDAPEPSSTSMLMMIFLSLVGFGFVGYRRVRA